MKHVIKIICSCLAIAGYTATLQAQDLAFAGSKSGGDASNLVSITSTPAPAAEMAATDVATKAVNSFNKSYKNAENVKWFAQNRNYIAMFDWNGLKAHALLGKNGAIHYDVRYGNEKDLPANMRRLIKSNYVDFAIGKAVEVNVEGKNAWVVNLQDADNIVIARVMDGALDELARYDTHPKLHKKARIIIPRD